MQALLHVRLLAGRLLHQTSGAVQTCAGFPACKAASGHGRASAACSPNMVVWPPQSLSSVSLIPSPISVEPTPPDSGVPAGVPDMQAAMAALAEAQSTASALTYTNPGVLAQNHPLAMLLANSSWLTHIPNIQQLLTQLPAPHPSLQQPFWTAPPPAAAQPAAGPPQAFPQAGPGHLAQPATALHVAPGPGLMEGAGSYGLPPSHCAAAPPAQVCAAADEAQLPWQVWECRRPSFQSRVGSLHDVGVG